MATAEQMCSYSNVRGVSRSYIENDSWTGHIDRKTWRIKSKRVRCPECGRSMMSAIRVCHDGCCVFHCIPSHKKKGWYRIGKTKKVSRDNRMKKR